MPFVPLGLLGIVALGLLGLAFGAARPSKPGPRRTTTIDPDLLEKVGGCDEPKPYRWTAIVRRYPYHAVEAVWFTLPAGSDDHAHTKPYPKGHRYECSPVSTAIYVFQNGPHPGLVVDEYGRLYRGHFHFSSPSAFGQLGDMLSQALPGPARDALAALYGGVRDLVGNLSNNELWDIAATGAYFVPGIGVPVSAGMAGAAAWGRRESLSDIALATTRGAIPSAAGRVGFDLAVAASKGGVSAGDYEALRGEVASELGPEAAAGFALGGES